MVMDHPHGCRNKPSLSALTLPGNSDCLSWLEKIDRHPRDLYRFKSCNPDSIDLKAFICYRS